MLCARPFTKDGMAFACGTCHPCRIQRQRVWAHRIILESTQHDSSAFITLTYDDKHLPEDHSVNVRHLQLFMKRLRKKGYKFRYYAVGEYGDRTLRPHYHMAIFGFPQCYRGQTDMTKVVCCKTCHDVKTAWGQGAIQVAFLEPASANYVAGYVTKKMNADPLPKFLRPEFQRMSLKPGLGYGVMHDVADVLLKYSKKNSEDLADVPFTLQHGVRKMPLGSYLRRKLRRMIGREEKCPEEILQKAFDEMQPVREAAFVASKKLSEEVLAKYKGRRASLLARTKIRKAKRKL